MRGSSRRRAASVRIGLACAAVISLLFRHGLADEAGLALQIAPPGTVVELRGPQVAVSASPNSIARPPAGWYQLRAAHPGYESWSTKLYIDASSPDRIVAQLSPKTRFKSGLRALLFPGWGHYYADRNGRGALVTALVVGAAGGYLYLDNRADQKVGDFEALQRRFDAAESVTEQERIKPELDAARRRAFDAESDRRNWGWGTVALYAYQVVDAVLFFPAGPQIELQGITIELQTPVYGSLGIGASYAF
jgi:hypothetical protein